jgi:hypothetical protein
MRSIKDKQAAREDSASTDHLDLAQAVPVSTPNLKFSTETMKRCRPPMVNARPKTAINSQRSDIIASLNDWNQTHRREHADFPAVWKLREGKYLKLFERLIPAAVLSRLGVTREDAKT